jgi:hypothetical protein
VVVLGKEAQRRKKEREIFGSLNEFSAFVSLSSGRRWRMDMEKATDKTSRGRTKERFEKSTHHFFFFPAQTKEEEEDKKT